MSTRSDLAREILPSNPFVKKIEGLGPFFEPQNVAVIGATEKAGSVGRTILWNLISSPFGGTVFPVNPKRPSVLGIKAYPSIGAVPEPVDLAVVVTPAPTVPGHDRRVRRGRASRAAIIISAGFKEIGPGGRRARAADRSSRRGAAGCASSARTAWA